MLSYDISDLSSKCIKSVWDKNRQSKVQHLPLKLWKVALVWFRAGEGLYEGDKRYASRVSAREDEDWVPGEDVAEVVEEENWEEGACGKDELIQQGQKVLAQQILKNNQMVDKYNKLDAQLQGVTFE